MTDKVRENCRDDCMEMGENACGCDTLIPTYDIGQYLFHMMAHYIQVGGQTVRTDLCQANMSCGDIDLPPAARTQAELD